MKVTIQHSINLEDVPEKAHELLIPVEENIDNAYRWLNSLLKDLSRDSISPELAAISIDRIRKTLSDCDLILGEVGSIMQGVADYEKEQLPPSYPPASADEQLRLQRAREAANKPSPEQQELEEKLHALAMEKREALLKDKEDCDGPDLPF